jgi:hypothetical protein
LPKALKRLQNLIHKGLEQTASLWPTVRAAYEWVKRVARLLGHTQDLDGNGVKRKFRAVLGAMARHQNRSAPPLANMLAHFRKVTRSYWPGLFHCDDLPELPRTNNDLEQFFGAHRYHERRTTGRKGASPALVLRGSVKVAAWAATRLPPFAAQDLVPENIQAWKALRHKLQSRQQQRVRRYRFRRAPHTYLAALEKDLLQLILPP